MRSARARSGTGAGSLELGFFRISDITETTTGTSSELILSCFQRSPDTKAPPVVRWVNEGDDLLALKSTRLLNSLRGDSAEYRCASTREWHDAFVGCPYALSPPRFRAYARPQAVNVAPTLNVQQKSSPIKTRSQSMSSLAELPSSHSPSAVSHEGYDPAGHRPQLIRARFQARRAFGAGVANCSLL